MKANTTWAGNGYENPQMWAFKKEMPEFNPAVIALNVNFRFCRAWIAYDRFSKTVLMRNGTWLQVFDFYLNDFGRVIGPADFASADNGPMQTAWRSAAMDFRLATVKT